MWPALCMDTTPRSSLVPINSAASCGVGGLGQGTKTYLSQFKDLLKTSPAILVSGTAPGISYGVGTVHPAKNAGSDSPQSINHETLRPQNPPLRYSGAVTWATTSTAAGRDLHSDSCRSLPQKTDKKSFSPWQIYPALLFYVAQKTQPVGRAADWLVLHLHTARADLLPSLLKEASLTLFKSFL